MPGLPNRVVQAYYPTWTSVRLTSLPAGSSGYNTIFLAFATSSSPEGTNGVVTYRHGLGNATIKTDVAALRAKGVCVVLSVGGASNYTHINTTARRDNFLNSIVQIYGEIGPFDGLDWNFETNYRSDQYKQAIVGDVRANIIWISQQLKAKYPGFVITMPPSPSASMDRDWLVAMNNAKAFDMVLPQYYDGGGAELPANVKFWVDALGDANKVCPCLIEQGAYTAAGGGSGTGTKAQIESKINSALASYPRLRGVSNWHSGIDQGGGYWIANTLGSKIRALGDSGAGGNTPSPTPTPTPTPTGKKVTVGSSSYPLAGTDINREAESLVIYTDKAVVTSTNVYGAEAAVAGGKVTVVADRQTTNGGGVPVPRGGYVLSGHGAARDWVLANAKVGATVTGDVPAPVTPTPTPIPTPVGEDYIATSVTLVEKHNLLAKALRAKGIV